MTDRCHLGIRRRRSVSTYVVGEVSDATAKGYGTFFTLRDVEATYVNCWRNYTQVRTQYQILNDIGATIDIHRQSAPRRTHRAAAPTVRESVNCRHAR